MRNNNLNTIINNGLNKNLNNNLDNTLKTNKELKKFQFYNNNSSENLNNSNFKNNSNPNNLFKAEEIKKNNFFKKKILPIFLFFLIFITLSLLILFFQEREYKSESFLEVGYLNRTYEIKTLLKLKNETLEKNQNSKIFIKTFDDKKKIKLESVTFHPIYSEDLLKTFLESYINYSYETRWNRTLKLINEWNITIEKRQNELLKLYPKLNEFNKKNLTLLSENETNEYEKLKNETFTKEKNIILLEQKKQETINKTISDLNQIKILKQPTASEQVYNKIIIELFLALVFSFVITIKIIN